MVENAVKQVEVQKVATHNSGQGQFVKLLPEDYGNGIVVLPPNQMLAGTKQTEFNSQLIKQHRNYGSHELAFANVKLPQAAAGKKQDLSVMPSGVNAQAGTTLLLSAKKKAVNTQT